MYETPDLQTDTLVRTSEIRVHAPEDFDGMRAAGYELRV